MSAGAHPVRLVLADDLRRSRFLLLFRLLLVLPHIVWFLLWGIAAWFVAFLNWLAVMFVAESPPDFHRFLAAYVRYATHVMAFLFLAANPFPGFLGRPGYPVDVVIDPPARQNRWAAGFRLVLYVPALVLATVLGWLGWTNGAVGLLGVAAVTVWFAGLVLGRSPRGLRDVSAFALGYSAQALTYIFVLTGRFPDSHPGRMLGDPTVPSHPVRLRVEDELRRSRFTVLFRLLLAFPHVVWLAGWSVFAYLAAFLNWFVALVGGRSWQPLHRFLAAYVRYLSHVIAFLSLVGNPFPGFTGRESAYPVAIVVESRQPQRRLVTLFRLLLAIPALFLLNAMSSVLLAVGIGAWFASLITGRMPSGLRALGAVIIRYWAQATAYLLVVTDRYPNSSFALRAEPPPPARDLLPAHGPPPSPPPPDLLPAHGPPAFR